MKRTFFLASIAFCFAATVFAAASAGTITSSSTFLLRGVSVSVDGVPNWPIAVGDELQTLNGAATIVFTDGSRVVVGPKSKASVESQSGDLVFRLLNGEMDVKRAQSSTLRVFLDNTPVPASADTTQHVSKLQTKARQLQPPPPGYTPPVISGR